MLRSSRLEKTLIVLLQVFLLAGWAGVSLTRAAEGNTSSNRRGAPRIQVDRDYVDYGTILLEQMIEHRTVIKNVGDALLVVLNVCHEHERMVHSKVLEGC